MKWKSRRRELLSVAEWYVGFLPHPLERVVSSRGSYQPLMHAKRESLSVIMKSVMQEKSWKGMVVRESHVREVVKNLILNSVL